MLDDDQDAGFQFQMDPEPGTTLSPHHYGAPVRRLTSLPSHLSASCASLIVDMSSPA